MPDILRYLLWTVLSAGLILIAIMAFWVFLIIIGIVVIARLIYVKLFNKDSNVYTTVIDADNPDEEFRIPKIK